MAHENDLLDDDIDTRDDWPTKRRIVPAEQTELSPLANLTSVFDLAFAPLKLRRPFTTGTRHPHRRIERGDGVTRYRQLDERDTEAYREREIQRRARQVVPRPTKAAKAYWSQFADGQQPRQEPKPKKERAPRPAKEPKPKPKREPRPRPEPRPRTDLERLERAISLVIAGSSLTRAAQEVAGISRLTIAQHMRARGLATPPSTRARAGAAA